MHGSGKAGSGPEGTDRTALGDKQAREENEALQREVARVLADAARETRPLVLRTTAGGAVHFFAVAVRPREELVVSKLWALTPIFQGQGVRPRVIRDLQPGAMRVAQLLEFSRGLRAPMLLTGRLPDKAGKFLIVAYAGPAEDEWVRRCEAVEGAVVAALES